MGYHAYKSLVLVLLCTSIQTVQCDTFHIVTSSSSPCPGESSGEPCLTIQQFADNSSQSTNTTLMFEDGNHSLSSLLVISNGYNFTMSGATATILCIYQRGTIQVQQFNHTLIKNIMLFGDCSGIDFGDHGRNPQPNSVASTVSVRDVQSFTVVNSWFENITNGALQISATSAITIRTSTFMSNGDDRVAGITVEDSGMVTVSDSTFSKHRARAIRTLAISSLHVTDCNFIDNYGESSGGAVNIERVAVTTFENSNFSYNTANKGAAIGAWAYLTIINCDFFANEGTRGGAIASRGYSTTIIGSTFTSNAASEDGGAIHATNVTPSLIQTSFINNTAGDNGGTVYLTGNANTGLRVFQSYFFNSTATGGAGGVIFTDANYANISIIESTFRFNSAPTCGVVDIESFNHHVNVTDSAFNNNQATGSHRKGGVGCVRNASIFILSSSFNHNTAAGNAGVFSFRKARSPFMVVHSTTTQQQMMAGLCSQICSPALTAYETASSPITQPAVLEE